MCVPSFNFVSLVVPEKSVTKIFPKKSLQTHTHNIFTEKTKTIHPLYTSYTGGINMKLSRTDNSPFSYDSEKEKSYKNKIARTEESESPIPLERAAKDSAMR